ncbi:winged helix-turn-helix domain-containing protein [Micromonospora endolithica]|uniref:ArsR family transcriptional regulator n=1 Tax=Micromonospora endolithica TaxID=230091 RepID=A0A3A9YVT9_9ACTN|nr:winged helix-turn-helix domain-containing protein [Micromonospora endolithica]RKN40182.1 ArsR family transcriptional regulator [Micromonospora endolithica]TWJ22483.1 DNA-binding transcriptional ArsR family regulator [Micromonospora endolithica]
MLVARLDGPTLARVRLALSPAAEATGWLRATLSRFGHPVHGDTGPAARSALRHPDVALLAALVTPPGRPGYTPDLLTPKPPPGPTASALDRQLDLVTSTAADQVREQVAARFAGAVVPHRVRVAVEDGSLPRRAAAGLYQFWTAVLRDDWPTLRAGLEAEVAARAAAMALGGVGSVLDALHPAVHWTGDTLTVEGPLRVDTVLTDTELVLAPSMLAAGVSTQWCVAGDAVLVFPARAGLPVPRGRDGLGELVGESRAALLADLGVPRSTGELSARHRLAPATVSYHLGVLYRSGLVVRQRDRRTVLYRRSPRGDRLVGEACGTV